MNQIPNIEETIKKLREPSNWLMQPRGKNWKDVSNVYDRTPFEAADLLETHHQQLQKAKEGMLHTLDSCIDNVTYAPKKPSAYKAWQDGFMEAYQQARKIVKHSKLDKPTV